MAYVPYTRETPAIKWARELQAKHAATPRLSELYMWGLQLVMTQVEMVRLAMEKVPFEELTPAKVWEFGANRMENYDTGLVPPITLAKGWGYGQNSVFPARIEGGKVLVGDPIKCPDVLGYKAYYDKEVAPKYK
jgi:hypothetical protein